MIPTAEVLDAVVTFLTARFQYATELQGIGMALQGAMVVRTKKNKDGKMDWFHAFAFGVIVAYGGALFTPFLMGKPSSVLSTDLNIFCCVAAYAWVNLIPFDAGYKLSNTTIGTLFFVVFAQMFRCMGIVKFLTVAHDAFKDNPSPYYPIPIVGPIMYATLLGNMGSFFVNGFDKHLSNGMPWPFQNGKFTSNFLLKYDSIASLMQSPNQDFSAQPSTISS